MLHLKSLKGTVHPKMKTRSAITFFLLRFSLICVLKMNKSLTELYNMRESNHFGVNYPFK